MLMDPYRVFFAQHALDRLNEVYGPVSPDEAREMLSKAQPVDGVWVAGITVNARRGSGDSKYMLSDDRSGIFVLVVDSKHRWSTLTFLRLQRSQRDIALKHYPLARGTLRDVTGGRRLMLSRRGKK